MTKPGQSNEEAKNQAAMSSKEQNAVKQLKKHAGEVVPVLVKGA